MKKFYLATRNFLRNEDGVTAVEYGLIAALIAVAVIVTVTLLGSKLDAIFQSICTKLNNGAACS